MMKSYQSEGRLKSNDWCPHKNRDADMQGRRQNRGRGRERSDASTRQETPSIAENQQKLEEAKKDPPSEPSEGTNPAAILISDFWSSELGNNFALF